jgi:hypothetical protein
MTMTAAAMDADGDFVVAWQRTDATDNTHVYFHRFSADGVRLGGATLAGANPQRRQFISAVAMDGDGDFVIAWYDSDVFARRFDAAGNPVAAEFQVNTTVNGNQLEPSIGLYPDGSMLVAWEAPITDGAAVAARQFDAAGAPLGGEFRVGEAPNLGNIVPDLSPSVAVAPDGQALVVWQVHDIPPMTRRRTQRPTRG